MDKVRGLRPKDGGIEIRCYYRGQAQSWFLNKPWNRTNCAEASRLRRQKLEELKLTSSSDHLRRENPPFQDVAQDYLEAGKTRWSTSYTNQVKRDINKIWLPVLGLLRIKDITVRDVRLADQGHGWSTPKRQQNARAILRGIFEIAIVYELIDTNPAVKLLKVSHQRPPIDPLSADEKEAILKKLTGQSHLFYLLAFETGLRTAELLGLKWSDIRGGKIYLERTMVLREYKTMKTKECRNVALTARAIEALESAVRPISGVVWINKDGTLLRDSKTLTVDWHQAMEDSGVRYRRPYNCRHTRASLGLSAGQTPAWLAKQLGHDLRTFFERYADYMDQNNDAAELAKLALPKNIDLGISWEKPPNGKPK